ncbi:MAG: TIM44-like domain-containing protein [Humidesulfovibrio sp.]|jgi:predicted lipid-binding transport protein (Tim44 family)|uniref:Tim44 domain-containing protein n=1 Tax=Humidesulfovibrio sp. TaxID=2910988 RepID=UPI0027341960|nr:TIM44-like domain-containing protein [Humidesulfovibrio sp.]MDP2848116.1 TIM44-like domain-containing protein [Humidesulfovibrio sp.]
MKTKMKTLSAMLALTLVSALLADAALAKRVGGGGSFGGKSSYSRSYTPATPSSPTGPAQTAPASRPMNQQAAPTPPPQAPGGMFSRMGWGLGGLVAGGLIGSMLFGGGGGWGAGGGMGMFDILLIGLVAFLAYKLFRRWSDSKKAAAASGSMSAPSAGSHSADPRSRAETSWGPLRNDSGQASTGGFGVTAATDAPAGPIVPQGFNVHEFLEGSKTVYARLQHSWDRRDLNDIALFTTPEVLAEIRRQAAADPTPSKTELLLVNAQLLEFREESVDTVVTVMFDVLMREDAGEERPKQIREVWHFSRPTADVNANWRLEGIQQLDS